MSLDKHKVNAGSLFVGQCCYTLTASVPGVSTPAKWSVAVNKSSTYTLQPAPGNPTTVAVGAESQFAVLVHDAAGKPAASGDVIVTFSSALGTFFLDGAVPSGSVGGYTRSPPFDAGTSTGVGSISVSAPGATTLVLPLTVTPAPPTSSSR